MRMLKLLLGDHILGAALIIGLKLLLYVIVGLLPVLLLLFICQHVELPVQNFEVLAFAFLRRNVQDVLFFCAVVEHLRLMPFGHCLEGLYVLFRILLQKLPVPLHLFLVLLHKHIDQIYSLIHLRQLQNFLVDYVRVTALDESQRISFEGANAVLWPLRRMRDQEFTPDHNVGQ